MRVEKEIYRILNDGPKERKIEMTGAIVPKKKLNLVVFEHFHFCERACRILRFTGKAFQTC